MPGADYKELAEGKCDPNYSAYLFKIGKGTDFENRVMGIASHISDVLDDIEKKGRMKISEFVIGKTYTRKQKRRDFKRNDFNTWKLDGGVNGRWNNKYKEEGYDGLIAVCAITRKIARGGRDAGDDNPFFEQENYALALEQQLIHHFVYVEEDQRVGNTSLSPGRLSKRGAIAYVIYIAFKLDTEE